MYKLSKNNTHNDYLSHIQSHLALLGIAIVDIVSRQSELTGVEDIERRISK